MARKPLPLAMMFPSGVPGITSHYGYRTHPIKKTKRLHSGLDLGAGMGTPFNAPFGGTVYSMGPMGGYGNTLMLDHGNGYMSRFAHLKGYGKNLKKGMKVNAGDPLGFVGSSGLSTGPHLHYEILKDMVAQNPEVFDYSVLNQVAQQPVPGQMRNPMQPPTPQAPTPQPLQPVLQGPQQMSMPANDPNQLQKVQSLIDGKWFMNTPNKEQFGAPLGLIL